MIRKRRLNNCVGGGRKTAKKTRQNETLFTVSLDWWAATRCWGSEKLAGTGIFQSEGNKQEKYVPQVFKLLLSS